MKINHNKKRNVGIIYEMLLKTISKNLVEGNEDKAKIAKSILKKYYKNGTEVYKEHRLFDALIKTNEVSEGVANRILETAKDAAQNHDYQKLHFEKSKMIKEINYKLDRKDFYNQKIKNYRNFATVQNMLNIWRSEKVADLKSLVLYESKVRNILMSEVKNDILENHKNPSIDNLTVKIMMEKFNSKYSTLLNEEQRDIIKSYIFSSKDEDYLIEKAEKIKKMTLKNIKNFINENKNPTLETKYSQVSESIKNVNISKVDDEMIGKTLTMSKLCQEILEK